MASAGEVTNDHFKGGRNINQGHREGSDATLDEILAALVSNVGTKLQGTIAPIGAGTTPITFATAFPSANYRVMLSTDTVAAVPIWATKLTTGFSITVAAACNVDWVAILD